MRGIGIQISRLEVCRAKRNQDNLISFFNKMEKLQPSDKTLGNATNKNQCASNIGNESKADSSEVPSSTNVSHVTSDDGLPLKSAQISEAIGSRKNGHAAILDTRAQRSTLEMRDKNLHNLWMDESIKVKESSGESNKKTAQRQTSQENFFKHTKPRSGSSNTKYEVPRMQDIDMSVLVELPEDIRNEIFDEYKRNKKQSQANTANLPDAVNAAAIAEESLDAHDCSQVDPDVLSTLMKSNLHPDVQRDVRIYCDMKRGANRTNVKETSEGSSSKFTGRSQAAESSARVDSTGKNVKSNVNNIATTEAACTLQEDAMSREKDAAADEADRRRSATTSQVEISRNNAVMDKADTFILQNLSILHNNENVDKHQEMLINLVNHLFTLPLHQVPHNYSFRQRKY